MKFLRIGCPLLPLLASVGEKQGEDSQFGFVFDLITQEEFVTDRHEIPYSRKIARGSARDLIFVITSGTTRLGTWPPDLRQTASRESAIPA